MARVMRRELDGGSAGREGEKGDAYARARAFPAMVFVHSERVCFSSSAPSL